MKTTLPDDKRLMYSTDTLQPVTVLEFRRVVEQGERAGLVHRPPAWAPRAPQRMQAKRKKLGY